MCQVVSFQARVAAFGADEFVVCMPVSLVPCQPDLVQALAFQAQVQTIRLSLPPTALNI
jgi:hypothetical protein